MFNPKEEITLEDNHPEGGGGTLKKTYETLLIGSIDYVSGFGSQDTIDNYETQMKEDKLVAICGMYEEDLGYEVISDKYDNLYDFLKEQKLIKILSGVLTEEQIDRINYHSKRAETNNLIGQLQEILEPSLKYDNTIKDILKNNLVENNPQKYIDKKFDFDSHMDKLKYEKKITYKIREGKLDYSSKDLKRLTEEAFKDKNGMKDILELDYFANGERVGGGGITIQVDDSKVYYLCDSYDKKREQQYYLHETINEDGIPKDFQDALLSLEAFAIDGMAIAIYGKENQCRDEVDMYCYMNSLNKDRDNLLEEKKNKKSSKKKSKQNNQ